MRVPLSWLAEYVELVPGTTPEDVHAALVRVGLEEEDVHTFELEGPIVVGEVLEFVEEPQSNGKTIRWCQVRVAPDGETAADGGDAVHGIVCGARNFFVGDKVVVTLPGAVLPGPFPIAARKTYGHVSDGMIASARELGLGDDHEGILRLSTLGIDAPVGTDAIALLGLDDAAIEINVTPDRGYAFSIRGVAREYAHATGARFRDPVEQTEPVDATGDGFPVEIRDEAPIRGRVGSAVFATRIVRDVEPDPSHAGVDDRAAEARRHPLALAARRHHELRDARARAADPRLRPRPACRGGIVVRRATPGEKLDHARRQGAHARRRGPGRHRRPRPHRPRRRHGRRRDRDGRFDAQRAHRGGQLGPRLHRAHRTSAQAAERGREALRARRRPRDRGDRGVPGRPAHGRPRGRHRRRGRLAHPRGAGAHRDPPARRLRLRPHRRRVHRRRGARRPRRDRRQR